MVITGATSGLGKATALAQAGAGARLVICSENSAALEATLSEMGGDSDRLCGLVFDVTDPDMVESLAKREGRIINLTGRGENGPVKDAALQRKQILGADSYPVSSQRGK
ncbi:hypothetical protein BST95_00870 [Halioglobus japonicus]|nr:hypothetical protein BST95_00870 [Halioglobus japonicus]